MLQDNFYASTLIGGLGAIGLAYLNQRIDQCYTKSLRDFEILHTIVDYRLEKVEEDIYRRLD